MAVSTAFGFSARWFRRIERFLQIHTRDADPLEWAGSQVNLSCSLAEQATLMIGHDDRGRLGEAVEAARAALHVYKREEHPLD